VRCRATALLAIGAIGESSRATGVNGNQTDNTTPYIGAAYVLRAHP